MLAEIFGVGVYAFALMANHVHLVVVVLPDAIRQLSDEEIVERWLRLYPSRTEERIVERRAEMLADPARIVELRTRLGSLSWFMKCLNEHIARIANKEDNAKGHFCTFGKRASIRRCCSTSARYSPPWRMWT